MQAFVPLPGTTAPTTTTPTPGPTPGVASSSQTLLASRQPLRSLPTTGFSPLLQPPKNLTSSQLLLDFTNETNNENNRNITNLNLSHSSPSTTSAAAKVTSDVSKFNRLIDRTPGPPCTTTDLFDPQIRWIESLHINIKLLILLIKHRPYDMLPFIDLLILRITPSTMYIPRAITLYCEQMIVELVKLTTLTNNNSSNVQPINRYPHGENTCIRVIHALLPYLRQNNSKQQTPTTATTTTTNNNNNSFDECVYMHLCIIHVLNQIMPYLLSSQLIEIMPEMVIILTFLNSSIVDIRQSVIFLLVTINRCIGYNILSIYMKDKLTHTQLSLLNIYIERDEKSQSVAMIT